MHLPPVEKRLRSGLKFIRWMVAYLPVRLMQAATAKQGENTVPPSGVRKDTVTANGVRCVRLTPDGAAPDRLLLYFHGGGFVFGISGPHIKMVGALARQTRITAVMVDYRLSPQHPFPAALDDCVAAYRWLLEEGFDPSGIAFAGDSAGGHLAVTTLMRLRDAGDPLPAGGVCLSPVTDLAIDRDTLNVKDPLLHPRALRMFNRSYVGQHDPATPLLSPILGDLSGLPPMVIHVGEDEILHHDAERLHGVIEATGGEVQFECFPRMWHVWQINPHLPQTADSLGKIGEFILARTTGQ